MRYSSRSLALVLAAVLSVAACESFMEVENPGGIQDENLDDPIVFAALVFGAEEDFSVALSQVGPDAGVMADEWTYVGTGVDVRNFAVGIIRPDQVDGHWNRIQRARWVAEDAVDRMARVWAPAELEQSPLAIRAHLIAGFANRLLGELFCEVVFDGGPAHSNIAAFERAEGHFSEAARMANLQGAPQFLHAALGGRASVRAWQDDWGGAVADAEQVPAEFVHVAMNWATGTAYPSPGSRGGNYYWHESNHRPQFTVAESRWGEVLSDPRVPWDSVYSADGSIVMAWDGLTPHLRQSKYPDHGADIPLVKGTEMLLLRAEARLVAGNDDLALSLIDEHRGHYGLQPLGPATGPEAWQALRAERAAEIWLEARRFWDQRRWNDPFLSGRDACIPISDRERRTNSNLH